MLRQLFLPPQICATYFIATANESSGEAAWLAGAFLFFPWHPSLQKLPYGLHHFFQLDVATDTP
jgi:hypothetical protein